MYKAIEFQTKILHEMRFFWNEIFVETISKE